MYHDKVLNQLLTQANLVMINVSLNTYLKNLSFSSVDPPEITEHPKSQSVPAGAKATFKIEAIGDHLSFQWWKNECNL